MRMLRIQLFGVLMLLAGSNVRAQGSGGDDADCAAVLDDAAGGCAESALAEKDVKALRKKQRELKSQLAGATKTPEEIVALQHELNELVLAIEEKAQAIEDLKDTPLEKLTGFCVSVAPCTPRPCDALASRSARSTRSQ